MDYIERVVLLHQALYCKSSSFLNKKELQIFQRYIYLFVKASAGSGKISLLDHEEILIKLAKMANVAQSTIEKYYRSVESKEWTRTSGATVEVPRHLYDAINDKRFDLKLELKHAQQ